MTQLWKEDAIMNRVKRAFLSREGVNGVRVAVRYFFELDTNKDGSISKEELSEGLAKHGLQLNADELNYLVKAFDTNRDGYISKEEFLAHLVGSLNNRRAQVVAKCYAALTARCGTPLRASDLIREFDASQHPLIKLGKATKDDIEKEFTGAFGVDADNDGYVSEREFQAFFTGVSATIPNDDVFETFMLRGLRADDPVAPRLAETERAWDKADPLGAPASMLHSAYSATLQATPQGKTYNASGLYRTKYNRPEPPLPSVRPDFVSTMKESYKPPTGAQLAASLPKKDFFSPTGNPILDLVRKKILDRVGTEGFVGLQRAFRTFDINRDQVITHTEIVKGLQRLQINLTPTEVKHVETAFDLNNGGGINLTEFCRVLRGPIRSPARVEILLLAFKTLDTSNDGLITVSEILPKYDVARHPSVKNGTKTPQQVIQDFIADWDANCDGIVTPAEWMDYYANISCTIDDDQYFELMIRNAWHISGGIGSAQNTTCRRVLATFKDGRQRVVEIENDMGLRKDDVDGMKDRLRAQGYADITAIQLAF